MTNKLTAEEIKNELLRVARNRCEPPVDEQMVAKIAERVVNYLDTKEE
jgi:hypothetical protein